jgi:TrmH family RNA methyltransferase
MKFIDQDRWRPLVKTIRRQAARLRSAHNRAKSGLFLLEGFRLLDAALAAEWVLEAVILRDDPETRQRFSLIFDKYHRPEIAIYVAAPHDIQEMTDTVEPPGILAVARQRPQDPSPALLSGRRLLVVDHVRDPGNLGAILRSAAAFGMEGVCLSRGTVDMYNPKVVRSSMGGLFQLPIVQVVETAELAGLLRAKRYMIYTADAHSGTAPGPVAKQARVALVIGGETEGLSDVWRECGAQSLHIRTAPSVESLNSAVAAGILLYQLFGEQQATSTSPTRRSTIRQTAGKAAERRNSRQ